MIGNNRNPNLGSIEFGEDHEVTINQKEFNKKLKLRNNF